MPRRCSVGARFSRTGCSPDHLVEDVPDLRALLLDELLRLLDGRGQTLGLEPRVDERLEQLQRHLLGQAALVQLQLGGRSRMTERPEKSTRLPSRFWRNRPCLPLSMSRQRFQRTLVGAGDHAAAGGRCRRAQSTDSCNIRFSLRMMMSGAAQLDQPLEAVVAVDDTAIEVVEVRRREAACRPAAPAGAVPGGITGMTVITIHSGRLPDSEEAFDDLQAFDDLLGLQFAGGLLEILAQPRGPRSRGRSPARPSRGWPRPRYWR